MPEEPEIRLAPDLPETPTRVRLIGYSDGRVVEAEVPFTEPQLPSVLIFDNDDGERVFLCGWNPRIDRDDQGLWLFRELRSHRLVTREVVLARGVGE